MTFMFLGVIAIALIVAVVAIALVAAVVYIFMGPEMRKRVTEAGTAAKAKDNQV